MYAAEHGFGWLHSLLSQPVVYEFELLAAELEFALIEDDPVPGAVCQVLAGLPEVFLDCVGP